VTRSRRDALLLLGALLLAPEIKKQPALTAWLPLLRGIFAGILVPGAAAAFLGLRRGQPRLMLGAITVACAAGLITLNLGSSALDRNSTKNLAMTLKPMLKADDRVYNVGYYAQDLPVYLDRLVSLVDFRGELAFGIDAEPALTAARFLQRKEFTSQWEQPGGAYAVVDKRSFNKWFATSGISYQILMETDNYVLAVKPPAP